ncbi:hypothetical protein [Coleofasciculus sp. H7-2]|uniref:hypothetical protein n=1 Tax=Coleofasciculus sp. H7-2 TaxID=3351545 RepID=UPI00366D90CA
MLHSQEWLARVASLLYEVGWLSSVKKSRRKGNRSYTDETRRKREKMGDRF